MKTNLKEVNELHNMDLYLYFYEDFIDEQRTSKECEFIIQECGLKPEMKILDLACGHGRHSIFFAKKGFKVSGIDLNSRFIELARKNADQQDLTIDFKADNMLNIEAEDVYDCVVLVFNSFGFLDKKDGIALIQKLKSAIKRDGKIFIDIKNRDSILKELNPCQVLEKGTDLMIDRLSFNPQNGTTTNNRIYIKDGVRYDTPFTMQLYHFSEFEELLANNGLEIIQSYGSWSGEVFGANSRRIILIIESSPVSK